MGIIESSKAWLFGFGLDFSTQADDIEHDLVLFDPENEQSNFCALQFVLADIMKQAKSPDHFSIQDLAIGAIRSGRSVILRGDKLRIGMLMERGNNLLDQSNVGLTSRFGLIEFKSQPVANECISHRSPARIGHLMSCDHS